MPPTEFYHGTSLEAALNIQKSGFNISLSGSNAGAALGSGYACCWSGFSVNRAVLF